MRLLLTILPFLFLGCKTENFKRKPTIPATVFILPLNNISDKITSTIVDTLEQHFPNVVLLAKEKIPLTAYQKDRKRYRADDILEWMNQRAKTNEKYIAITNIDISTTKGSIKDWGIMGLANQPGKVAVASNFRLRDKNNLYKVVLHELAHTTGLPHCPEKNCFLRDAKGGDHTSTEKSFCNNCKQKLIQAGWRL